MMKGLLYPLFSPWDPAQPVVQPRLVVLALSLTLFSAAATVPRAAAQSTVEWARSIVSQDYNAGVDIVVDANGDIIMAGVYRDEVSFDNKPQHKLFNQGSTDILLAKISASGEVIWMQTIGGVGEDRAFRIATDEQGHIFITGSFERVLHFDAFDTFTLESRGKTDAFLAKYDAEGNVLWTTQAGGERSDQGIGLALDSAGNAYVSGFFEETASFDNQETTSLSSHGQLDAFVAKYDESGALVWTNQLGGDKRDLASGVAVNAAGEVYLTGVTRGPETMHNINPDALRNTPLGQDDVYLAKFSPTGTLTALTYAGGRGFDAANAIDIDQAGNVYVVGFFQDDAFMIDFNENVLPISGEGFDLFVTRFNTDGNLAWTRTAGGGLWDNAYDVDVDDAGFVHVTGLFRKSADFNGANLLESVEGDIEGQGEANAFVAKYEGTGALAGIKVVDGTKSEGTGVAVGPNGEVLLTGLFLQEAMFDENEAPALTSNAFNSFIAKYSPESLSEEGGTELPGQKISRLAFSLSPSYPNPFFGQTSFEVQLFETSSVRLIIHDALGRVMEELYNNELAAGIHQFFYDASRLARGTYYYTLQTSDASITRSMTVAR